MNETSEARTPGWWLPAPDSSYGVGSPERTARFRFAGAWVIRLWMVLVASFGGLLWAQPALSMAQALFGAGVFAGATGLLLLAVMAAVWTW